MQPNVMQAPLVAPATLSIAPLLDAIEAGPARESSKTALPLEGNIQPRD